MLWRDKMYEDQYSPLTQRIGNKESDDESLEASEHSYTHHAKRRWSFRGHEIFWMITGLMAGLVIGSTVTYWWHQSTAPTRPLGNVQARVPIGGIERTFEHKSPFERPPPPDINVENASEPVWDSLIPRKCKRPPTTPVFR